MLAGVCEVLPGKRSLAGRFSLAAAWFSIAFLLESAGADQFFSLPGTRIDNRPYPVTELRMVREPGNFHFVQTNESEFILSDYWWREVKVAERRYTPGQQAMSPGSAPVPGSAPGPAIQTPTQQLRRKVFVEIVGGKGYEFFGRERLKPTSFTLIENRPRNVPIRFGNSRGTLVAVYDGYHVDLGLDKAAKVVPGYNGVIQDMGSGQGLDDVAVVAYWEEDPKGEPMPIRPQAPGEPESDLDAWGLDVKTQVLSKQKAQNAPPEEAPSAPPEASPSNP